MPLKPFINIEFNAPVWRMEIDETTDTLFTEVRDSAEKRVSFAGIDLNTGGLNFKDLTMPERWLSGLEAANMGVLLINGYLGDTLPVHKGLTAIDGATGHILWSNYNIAFEQTVKNGFVVTDARIEPKKLFLIDTKTGQQLSAYKQLPDGYIETNIVYPHAISPKEIPIALKMSVYGNEVHYLSHNNFRIVSLHALNEGILTQHLYVLDNNGNLVFEDIIAGQIQKLQPEAFISYKNKLIWLKNRSVIKVLNL